MVRFIKLYNEGLPATIWADGRILKQVMYNLLSNAVKFTPIKGAIKVIGGTLTTSNGTLQSTDGRQIDLPATSGRNHSRERKFAQITVQDNGIGLESENLELIFGAFDQVETSRSRKFQGTGLGLALTRRFVEMHGGAIWAESEGEGHGCKMIFALPVETVSEVASLG